MGILDALDQSFGVDRTGFGVPGPSTAVDSKAAVREALQRARDKQAEDIDQDEEEHTSALFSPAQAARPAFHLNYDKQTPIRPIDIGGEDQSQRLAEFVTTAIDNLSHDIDVKGAMKELGLSGPRDILPGLEVRLLGHQCIGVAWMLRMEKGHHKGGILADDMGLGKTVQMISTMAMNMPSKDVDCKTTLIVVPAALMQQWKEECETKANDLFKVHIHHGKDKLKKPSQVRKYDVVITSYQTLCMDFATHGDVQPEEEAEWVAKYGGTLARVHFYRVVADEAQFIRNRATRASVSMALVRATHRWTLTGTPVTNTLADIYGLLRFGRFRPWNDWNDFNRHVAKVQMADAPLAGSRAQAILKPLILRRTKNSTLEGKPILQLPPKEIELVKLKFSQDERNVYDHFESSVKMRINKFIREGTLLKNHEFILVMILRLRQLCCHPNLILSNTGEYEDPTDIVKDDTSKELSRARKAMGHSWVNEVKKMFLKRATTDDLADFGEDGNTSASACPVCQEALTSRTGRVLSCKHEMCFDCALDTKVAPIAHNGIFGYGTEKENLAAEKAFEEAQAKGYRPCPTCNVMVDLSAEKTFLSAAFEPTDDELHEFERSKREQKRKSRRRSVLPESRMQSPSPVKTVGNFDFDDSDDDLPDAVDILDFTTPKKAKGKAKVVLSSDDDDEDIFSSKNKAGGRKPKRKVEDTDNSSDIEFLGMTPSSRKLARGAKRAKASSESSDVEVVAVTPARKKAKPERYSSPSAPPESSNKKKTLSESVLATWRRGDADLEPSTKMLALVEYLKMWEATGDKTICYSQWTSMLDLIEILLARYGIRTLRFDGKMDRYERAQAIANFKRAGGPRIMLISTRCGSVGLNLVMANRIVNMDLSWNYAAESQAYDRCHRIGQDKSVFVKRLVVENTIEERMLRLQDVKVGLAEAALGEGTGAKLHKLSVKDIKMLFGISKPDIAKGSRGRQTTMDVHVQNRGSSPE